MRENPISDLRGRLLLFTISRTVLNTGFRLVYPFIATFARALGVEVESIALAITARSALGLTAPILGNLGDSLGRKSAMLLGLSLFTLGFALVLFFPTYPSLFTALLLGAAGKIIFDPAMQAYLGDQVDYRQRGTAIAIAEFGWSGASLLGLPLVGWLIARSGWMTPFPALALLMMLNLLLLWRALPADTPNRPYRSTLGLAWRSILAQPSAVAALITTLLISIGNETVNIVYGLWLEGSFGLQVAAIGAASAVIGLAEFSGEGLVATITDRIGKKRAVSIGVFLTAAACLLLPLIGHTLSSALIGLFFFYLTFEFTFVSLIPLVTEVVPSSRATLMAGNLAAAAGGRSLGALIGALLYTNGIALNAAFGALITLIAGLVLWRFVTVE